MLGSPSPLRDVAAAVLSVALAALALALLRRFAAALPVAVPNARSLHGAPVTRVGGLAIWCGGLPAALLAPPAGLVAAAWLAGFTIVALVSAIDDWRGVHPLARLAAHAAAAAVAVAGFDVPIGVAAAIGVGFAIMWSANLYNFMDGSDGLAALMAVVGFATLGAASAIGGAPSGSFYGIAGAALVFLAVNVPPARVFMGDVGAVPLGYLACAWGAAGAIAGVYPAWLVVLAFMPFWSDATVTLAARIARGERLLDAHRSHYYQKLHRLGAGHCGTLLGFGVLMLLTSGTALVTLAFAPAAGWAAVAAWSAMHAAVFVAIEYHWRKRRCPQ